MNLKNKNILSKRKFELYTKNAKIIKFLRRNPVLACEVLLGIRLLDFQKWILQESWNKPYVLLCNSRNAGKSFLGAIIIILKAVLYENQAIYIISSVGSQAIELFNKIEEITLRIGKTSNSIVSLKDIVFNETVKSPACKTGFSHNPAGFHVEFYNGSEIFTLNGNPDNNRSRRASMVFFDEAGFSSAELIAISEAFATQNSDFKTSIEKTFNIKALHKNCPTQLIYASSASDVDTTFYRHYKNFAKRMFLGDNNYFCCDIPCDIPLNPTMDGKLHPPLLTQSKVDNAMKANRDKALREYYNKFSQDGGDSQIVKWGTIRRNETLILPELSNKDNSKFALAFDPARVNDASILSAMKIKFDSNIGFYGEIVNCTNLVDIASKRGYKMTSTQQIKTLRDTLLAYNGSNPDYENIEALLIDSGAGGGGVNVYADALLEEWTDDRGNKHRGLLDSTYKLYEGFDLKYPDAIIDRLRLIEPKKFRTQMVDEFLELLGLDLIKFPKEYNNSGSVTMSRIDEKTGEMIIYNKSLSFEEEVALTNIDALKTEITSIYKFSNPEGTSKTYALPKDKEKLMKDDRFYTIIMLAHYLFELRRKNITNRVDEDSSIENFAKFLSGTNRNQSNRMVSKIFR